MKPEAIVFAGMVAALAAACAQTSTTSTSQGTEPAPVQVAASTPTTSAAPPAATSAQRPATSAARGGYLDATTRPDATSIIPPAPVEGDDRNTTDWAIFRATRAIQKNNPERWALAQNDDKLGAAALLADFSCSVGVELTEANSPTLRTIISRTSSDAGAAASRAKDIYKRTRPFLHNAGEICIDREGGIARSYDYPSGHTSLGWAVGMALAQIDPANSQKILTRARAFGESRVVCGVHNWSAVEGGRTNAASVFAALQGVEAYQADVAKARTELAAARASGKAPEASRCTKEAELTQPLKW